MVIIFWLHKFFFPQWYKGSVKRHQYLIWRNAVIVLQAAWRGWKERAHFLRLRRSALTLQRHLRGAFAREVAAALREMKRVNEEIKLREERNRSVFWTDFGRVSVVISWQRNNWPFVTRCQRYFTTTSMGRLMTCAKSSSDIMCSNKFLSITYILKFVKLF